MRARLSDSDCRPEVKQEMLDVIDIPDEPVVEKASKQGAKAEAAVDKPVKPVEAPSVLIPPRDLPIPKGRAALKSKKRAGALGSIGEDTEFDCNMSTDTESVAPVVARPAPVAAAVVPVKRGDCGTCKKPVMPSDKRLRIQMVYYHDTVDCDPRLGICSICQKTALTTTSNMVTEEGDFYHMACNKRLGNCDKCAKSVYTYHGADLTSERLLHPKCDEPIGDCSACEEPVYKHQKPYSAKGELFHTRCDPKKGDCKKCGKAVLRFAHLDRLQGSDKLYMHMECCKPSSDSVGLCYVCRVWIKAGDDYKFLQGANVKKWVHAKCASTGAAAVYGGAAAMSGGAAGKPAV
jgi:hypothetical protein